MHYIFSGRQIHDDVFEFAVHKEPELWKSLSHSIPKGSALHSYITHIKDRDKIGRQND